MALTAADKAKIAALEAEITQLKATVSDRDAQLADNASKLELANQGIEMLVSDRRKQDQNLATLTAERDEARQEAEEATAYAQELNQELTAQANQPAAVEALEHDGKKYTVTAPTFTLKGTTYQASDVKTGTDLLAQLVALNAGVLAEVSE